MEENYNEFRIQYSAFKFTLLKTLHILTSLIKEKKEEFPVWILISGSKY